jgi:hypothetical protein
MTDVTIKIKNGNLIAISPFHKDLPRPARNLGGRWNGSSWVFDPRAEDRVRALYIDVYGTDGTYADLVDVRITVSDDQNIIGEQTGIFICGRQIVRATSRDSGAEMGDKVSFIEGEPDSGGSIKNWVTVIPASSVFEVWDLPKAAVQRAIDNQSEEDGYTIEIIAENKTDELDSLIAQRDALNDRIAEIESQS